MDTVHLRTLYGNYAELGGTYIEDPVSEMLLSGDLHEKTVLKATRKGEDEHLSFESTYVAPPEPEKSDESDDEPELESAESQST